MASVLLLPVISLLLFVFSNKFAKKKAYLALGISSIVFILLLNLAYIHPLPGAYENILRVFVLVSIATAISIFFIYLIGIVSSRHFGVFYTIVLIILASSFAYISMYGFSNASWNGVDELAANYYSAYLSLHGVNPYTTSMQTIYNARQIFPTVLLNGSYEDFYAYPAMSFIAYIPLVAIGIGSKSLLLFVAVLIFFAITSSSIIYIHSGSDMHMLIPIAIWLIGCYALVGVSNALLVSIFLVLAFVYKNRGFASGIFLGIAASVSQLAWFALPFFLILTYRSKGKLGMQVLGASASFIAINVYFFALSPGAFIGSIFSIMSPNTLVFFGQDIAQFFYAFYPVSQLYISALSITVLLFSMLVYYIYPKSAKLLLALAPMLIFFVSWRNVSIYGLAYIPLLLAVYYDKSKVKTTDMLKKKYYIIYGIVAIIALFSLFAVYSHSVYAAEKTISINHIYPIIGVSSYGYSMQGFIANVSSNANRNETVTFYMISRSPNEEAYMLGSLLPKLRAGSTMNYTVNFILPLVNSNTKVLVFAFSKDYITSNVTTLSKLR
ncbi:MAG: hypothetical protein ACP5FN_01640 [Candidatus Micrarchaeia archaeon]